MSGMVSTPDGNRFGAAGPVHLYRTYGAALPLKTHTVPATCEEVDCEQYLKGWSINAALLSERNIAEIKRAGYRYIVLPVSDSETLWVFEAGQSCFKSSTHRRDIRPPLFYRRRGDWRGNPDGGPATQMRVEDWVDDFANNMDRLQAEIEKG